MTESYTLLTHSLSRKSAKFHYNIHRIEQITLLLVMVTYL